MISFELEVVGYTIALAYCLHKGLPFSAYGELLFLLIQGALTFCTFSLSFFSYIFLIALPLILHIILDHVIHIFFQVWRNLRH